MCLFPQLLLLLQLRCDYTYIHTHTLCIIHYISGYTLYTVHIQGLGKCQRPGKAQFTAPPPRLVVPAMLAAPTPQQKPAFDSGPPAQRRAPATGLSRPERAPRGKATSPLPSSFALSRAPLPPPLLRHPAPQNTPAPRSRPARPQPAPQAALVLPS